MSGLIMGVDCGGTKSHLLLFNAKGECVTSGVWGCMNPDLLAGTYDELEVEMRSFFIPTLEKVGVKPSDIDYSVFGVAGVDTSEQHEIISAVIKRVGFENFLLCNDSYLGIAAGCPGGVGICAINGTGTSLGTVDYSGNTQQVGGVGPVTDDRGGGHWYGAQAAGAVYNSLFKLGKSTIMRDMIFEQMNIESDEDFVAVLAPLHYSGELYFAEFNRIPALAAQAGDPVAVDILKRSAENFSGAIAYFVTEMDFPIEKPLYVVLVGSVFVNEEVGLLRQYIEEQVEALLSERNLFQGRTIKYVSLEDPPVAGAVYWASQKVGNELEMSKIVAEISSKL
jgi:N-acetylglucosamine kinase-like BadF-type ATPase